MSDTGVQSVPLALPVRWASRRSLGVTFDRYCCLRRRVDVTQDGTLLSALMCPITNRRVNSPFALAHPNTIRRQCHPSPDMPALLRDAGMAHKTCHPAATIELYYLVRIRTRCGCRIVELTRWVTRVSPVALLFSNNCLSGFAVNDRYRIVQFPQFANYQSCGRRPYFRITEQTWGC